MQQYDLRYPGLRWAFVYGSFEGVETFALEELYRKVQLFQPYVVGLWHAAQTPPDIRQMHLILVGTPQDNPWIAELVQKGAVTLPREPEGYSIACVPSLWHPERRALVVAGADPAGMLRGAVDFIARILTAAVMPEKPAPERLRQDQTEATATREHWPRACPEPVLLLGLVCYSPSSAASVGRAAPCKPREALRHSSALPLGRCLAMCFPRMGCVSCYLQQRNVTGHARRVRRRVNPLVRQFFRPLVTYTGAPPGLSGSSRTAHSSTGL